MLERTEAMDAGAVAAELENYARDCAEARTWGGPTMYPSNPVTEQRAVQMAKAIRDALTPSPSVPAPGFAEVEHQAEAAECAHMVLDDMKVPREDDGGTLSLVGRIRKVIARAYLDGRSAAEADRDRLTAERDALREASVVAVEVVGEMQSEIDGLKNELAIQKAASSGCNSLLVTVQKDCIAATARADRLTADLGEAVKALEPFAKTGELFPGDPPVKWDQCIYNPAAGDEYNLTGDHLRRARATLASLRARSEASHG